jgi:pyruvate-formate lyase-activating enzyme
MEKLRRTPFRCRGCHNRFYMYIPREKDEVDETVEPAETTETPDAENGHSEGEAAHKPDVAKPAEP